jgi:hypothetical protein
LGQDRIDILGHVLSDGRSTSDPEKVRAVTEYVTPSDPHDIQKFLGFIGFYRDYIPNFSLIALWLFSLLKKDVDFKWYDSQALSFQALKDAVTSDTCLALPDWKSHSSYTVTLVM